MAEVRIGVIGVAGRVGRMLVADIEATEGCALSGGVARPGSAACGQDLGELAGIGHLGVAAAADAEALLRASDVAIEFTSPSATAEHAALAARLRKPLVIGPSGTALALGRAAALARGADFADVAVRGRDGITGARPSGAIGFAALRGGDNIGEHHVVFAGLGEHLELTHRATNRGIYAKGAVRAALWLADKPPGLYGMKEVLGL